MVTTPEHLQNPFNRSCWNRVHRYNKDCLVATVGQRGSGKSWTSLSECEQLDPSFLPAIRENPESRIFFSSQDYANVFESCKKGQAFIFDEAGVGIDHRKWYNLESEVMRYLTQIQRHRNLIMFFTVPNLKYIDSDLRNLFFAAIQVIDYNPNTKANRAYVFKIVDDPVEGEKRFIYPRYIINNRKYKMKHGFNFQGPSKEASKIYEEYSRSWKQEFEAEQKEKFAERTRKEQEPKTPDLEKIANDIWRRRRDFVKKDGRWDKGAINIETKLGRVYISRILDILERRTENAQLPKHL